MAEQRLILTLGLIGGTGKEGKGLAYRWARAGYNVIIGSRTKEKAEAAAQELNGRLGGEQVRGMLNPDAAWACDIAILTVPYEAHTATLESVREMLTGKVLVDVTVPVRPPKVSVVHVPAQGSAARESQGLLGDQVRVVSAFQNVSHVHLAEDHPIACDVLVSGDDAEAKEQVLRLVEAAGMVGWDAGPLANAIVAEGMTSVLIGINRRYKMKGAGIRITGIDPV
ncbi:MAG TPA: NADPH-dependent F420 reductase [Anaerolineales bacterium]|nr:NADPH-dependent F420 reductase [Anaerolineales bacterium]